MKKLMRPGVVLGALLGVLGINMTPAGATTTATITFQGKATVSPGLNYPCFPNLPGSCPPALPGPRFGFAFGSSTCVGVKTDVAKKSTTGPVPGGVYTCVGITAQGTGNGYCGLSTASGTATIHWSAVAPTMPEAKSTNVQFSYVGVGGELVINGTAEKTPEGPPGTLWGVATAVPQPTPPFLGEGCAFHGGATQFTIIGTAEYTEVTAPVG